MTDDSEGRRCEFRLVGDKMQCEEPAGHAWPHTHKVELREPAMTDDSEGRVRALCEALRKRRLRITSLSARMIHDDEGCACDLLREAQAESMKASVGLAEERAAWNRAFERGRAEGLVAGTAAERARILAVYQDWAQGRVETLFFTIRDGKETSMARDDEMTERLKRVSGLWFKTRFAVEVGEGTKAEEYRAKLRAELRGALDDPAVREDKARD
jgi:hypothetical protein